MQIGGEIMATDAILSFSKLSNGNSGITNKEALIQPNEKGKSAGG